MIQSNLWIICSFLKLPYGSSVPLQELYQLLIYPFACCAVLHISAKVRTSSGNAPPAHCYIPHLSGYGQVSKELKPETWTKQCTKQHKVSGAWNPTKGRTVSAWGKTKLQLDGKLPPRNSFEAKKSWTSHAIVAAIKPREWFASGKPCPAWLPCLGPHPHMAPGDISFSLEAPKPWSTMMQKLQLWSSMGSIGQKHPKSWNPKENPKENPKQKYDQKHIPKWWLSWFLHWNA